MPQLNSPMNEATYPKPVSDVVSTVAEICRHQRKLEIVELLEGAHARFDQVNYDNWNGGTFTWALRLEVPIGIFGAVQSRLGEIEKDILGKLDYLARQYPNHLLNEVTISPTAVGAPALGSRLAPSELEVRQIWPEGRFRLFLSHLAKHKAEVARLKEELRVRGVAAFVAHEDIEPSLEWQTEIELRLRSMHAMAALLTPEFNSSSWTDQEIGWALGRGVLVVPVRLGIDPYGFVGKFQGVRGSLENPSLLAGSIVQALIANRQTHGEMRRALVSAFVGSISFAMSKALKPLVVQIADFSTEEKEALQRACSENSQVMQAIGVRSAIFAAFGDPKPKTVAKSDDTPF
jgi:hypothetical protein